MSPWNKLGAVCTLTVALGGSLYAQGTAKRTWTFDDEATGKIAQGFSNEVVDGKRTLIQNVDIPHSDGWHTIRVEMKGEHIACYYDGKKHLEADDSTFREPGKIGLWTKADAHTEFDDLTLAGR